MKKFTLAFVILLVAAGALFAQADLQPLVVVNLNNKKNETITVKQLKTRVRSYEKQIGKSLSIDDKKKVLDSLIDEKLMLQAAANAGISIPDSTVDQYFIQSLNQQIGGNFTEKELSDYVQKTQNVTLDQLLTQQLGMNVEEYKAYLKSQLIIQQYVVSQKQSEIQRVTPSDEEIRMFYDANKASFVQSDMAKTFVVIVPKNNDPDAAKNKLNEFRNKYKDKKITKEQLIAQSKLADSGFQAGEILLPKNAMASTSLGISDVMLLTMFKENEGFVSDLIETPTDYKFIVILKKYEAKILSISDLVQPETTVTVYDYIRANLGQQKQLQFVQTVAQEMAAEINTPENVKRKKTGSELDQLLNWGE